MKNETDQFITVNQCSIRFREAGNGPTLVLVHGIAGYKEEWQPAINILQEKFRVIALDLPGHGLSGKPDIAYTISNLTDFVKSFFEAMQLEKVFLAGHSLGGAITLSFTMQYPHLVERLILLNSAFTQLPLFIRLGSLWFLPHVIRKVPFCFVKASAKRAFYDHSMITNRWLKDAYRYMNEPGALRVMFSIIRSNMTLMGLKKELRELFLSKLNQLTTPTLILYGEKDRVVPNRNSKALHQVLPVSDCVPFENCGHELQYECCEQFCEQVIRFLNQKNPVKMETGEQRT